MLPVIPCFSYFADRVSQFCLEPALDLNSPIYASFIAKITRQATMPSLFLFYFIFCFGSGTGV
jgi:hypothetical protein